MALFTSSRSLGGCSMHRPAAGAFRLHEGRPAYVSCAMRRPNGPRILSNTAQKGDKAVAPAFAAPSKQQRYLAQENTLQEARRSACAGLDLPFQSRSHGLIGSFIDLAAAQGRLALKKAYSGASLRECTRGEIAKAERTMEALSKRAVFAIHDALNGTNTLPGANFLSLPKSLSLTLLDTCLAGGYITLDGQPIYCQQPAQPYTVDIWAYLRTSTSLVGRHKDMFGTSDMRAVPDRFPWLNTSTLASLLPPSMATQFLASVPAAADLVNAVSAIQAPSMAQPALAVGRKADILWSYLLVRRFSAAFAEQVQAAKRVVAAAAAAGAGSAGVSRGQARGGRPRTSGDGGSGRGGVLTAVGAGDEAELPLPPVLVLPVQTLAGSDSTCGRKKGWLHRLVRGAGRVVRLLRV